MADPPAGLAPPSSLLGNPAEQAPPLVCREKHRKRDFQIRLEAEDLQMLLRAHVQPALERDKGTWADPA